MAWKAPNLDRPGRHPLCTLPASTPQSRIKLLSDMEIFVQNLPFDLNSQKVRRGISYAIRKTFQRTVEFGWQHFKNKRSGKLTFPTLEIGREFLDLNRGGFKLRGRNGEYRTIRVSQSKYPPNARLVEGLQRRMEERRLSHSDSEEDDHGACSNGRQENEQRGLQFKGIQWGVWMSGGIFGRCGTIQRSGRMTYNSETGEVIADIHELASEVGNESTATIDNSTIRELFLVRDTIQPRLFLTLDRIPQFLSQNDERHNLSDTYATDYSSEVDRFLDNGFSWVTELFGTEDPPFYRIPALCLHHAVSAPYCTVYVFNIEATNLEKGLRRLGKSMKRDIPLHPPTYALTSIFDFSESYRQLQKVYLHHHYSVAFLMESYVRNCLLIPSEVSDLTEQILQLTSKYGPERTVRILQNLASQLPIRTFERLSEPYNLTEMLRNTERKYFWEPKFDPANSAWIHRLDITPAAYNMAGPDWMGTNRVLRLFPKHHDRFLKVSFVEEDLTQVRQTKDIRLDVILNHRWASVFKPHGINLCGRYFDFLGFSQSSLREHSAWFLSPFEDVHHDRYVTAESLRSDLGDFSHIRCPGRLAARIGQTFTRTSQSLDLEPSEVRGIEDVIRGPYVFSDGVGTISQTMIERVWKSTPRNEKEARPVVYQIRIGGAKGVVSLDKTLEGSQVCLRPSMKKFEAKYAKLEIANKGRKLPFFLTRQMIIILETLGLYPDNLVTLQENEITRLKIASCDFSEASRLCKQYGLGEAVRLQKILRTLENEGISAIFEMPFFRKLNALSLSIALKQIKYKTRIAVDRSWKLIGVMDEFKQLKEGDIYVCLKDDETGNSECLEGDTLVTRSPALYGGDIQKVHAIGSVEPSHPLSSLYNCIVFSSEGSRPLPNQLSGGDLDGDLFDVSQNPLLFPPSCEPPDSYPSAAPEDLGRECTIDDVSKFFLNFICNDNLGQICTRHAIIADQSPKGVRDEDCVKLSRLASAAVDFPKTGKPINIRDAPYVDTRIKPDFMAQQPISEQDFVPGPPSRDLPPSPSYYGTRRDQPYFYRSNKVLGKMYRTVEIGSLLETWNANSGWNEEGPKQLWQMIETNLKKIVPSYKRNWPEYLKEAEDIFETYMEELKMIQWYYHPTPWKKSLSEAEVFLQCIAMSREARYVRGRGKTDYLQQLREVYSSLVDWVRSEILVSVSGRYRRAAACFYVGVHLAQKRKSKEGESFAWLVVPDLFETWKIVQENNFNDDGINL